jgi:transcription termination factor NusB
MEQINRSELRKKIMTILYQINVYEANEMEFNVEELIKESLEIDNEFVKEIVYGVVTYKNDIDDNIFSSVF